MKQENKTRLECVINEVKAVRKLNNRAWIFDDNGNIADNVLCCEVLDVLEELKDYEINISNEWIEEFKWNPNLKMYNTYNWNSPISNDLCIKELECEDGSAIMLIMVHLIGDIRAGYSEYFAVKFDSIYKFYDMESLSQSKDINDCMTATMNIFYEGYDVYDYDKQCDVGQFYDIDVEDLLSEIKAIECV